MAVKTWTGTTNSNWNVNTNWTAGGGATTFPTAVDDVVFTAGSPNLIINVASSCLSIDFTNYVNTITFNANITVSGNVKLVAGFTQAGPSNGIVINANSTITSNGITWTRTFGTSGTSVTLTLSGDLTLTGVVTLYATNTIINGSTLYTTYLNLNTGCTVSGSSLIAYTGVNGIWATNAGFMQSNVTINSSSTLTINTFNYNTGTFTYTLGTLAGTLNMGFGSPGTTTTLNTGTQVFTNLNLGAGSATNMNLVLNSNLLWSGTLTISNVITFSGTGKLTPSGASTSLVFTQSSGSSPDYSNGFSSTVNILNLTINLGNGFTMIWNGCTINVSGNLTLTNGAFTGSSTINMIGSGTISGAAACFLRNNLTINTTGSIIITGTLNFDTATLTYTTASSVTTTGSTLVCALSTTLNTGNGTGGTYITWNNVTLGAATVQTYTLNSNLTSLGTLTLTGTAALQPLFTGTGRLNPTGSLTINSNGTYDTTDFLSTLNLSGTLTLNTLGAASMTLNGITFNVSGSLLLPNNGAILGTSSVINMVGTGSWNNSTSNMNLSIPLTINTSGTITVVGVVYFTGTFTYTQGTVVTTGSTLTFYAGTYNAASPNIIWTNVTVAKNRGTAAYTLNNDINFAGTLQVGTLITSVITLTGTGKFVPSGSLASFTIIAATADYSFLFNSTVALKNVQLSDSSTNANTLTLTFNSITFNISGSLIIGNSIIAGSASINMIGSGNVAHISNSYPLNGLRLNFTINTSGIISIGYFMYNTGTFTFTAGTVTFAGFGNNYIVAASSTTFNTNTLVIATNVQFGYNNVAAANTIITFNSTFICTGTISDVLYNVYNMTYTGVAGFITNGYTATSNQIFKSGNTYTINKTYTNLGGLSTLYLTSSSTTGSPAYITLTPGASCIVGNQSFTDIDASGGRQINVFSGVLVNIPSFTRTKNIYRMTDLLTVGS